MSTTTATTDLDTCLIARSARGDQSAFGELYDRHAHRLLALGVIVLQNKPEAEDLLHEVFLESWRQCTTYDPRRGSVASWLRVRMRSRLLDRLRVRSRAKRDASRLGPSPVTSWQDPTVALCIRPALSSLTHEQRKVIMLAYFQGLTCSEIASWLGIPLGTVKSRLAKGLARLRAVLLSDHGLASGSGASSMVCAGAA
jgi:RNA polymerase sigma-70 factor (ECF subfamily)